MTSAKLSFDYDLTQFLSSNSHIISLILLNGDSEILETECNYIKLDENNNVSYILISKIEDNNDLFFNYFSLFNETKNRTSIKIGRFVKKVLKKESYNKFNITNQTIEEFVNLFKSYFNCSEKNLHVVSGDDIKKWYLESNYSQEYSGTLWKSCMRQEERNQFLELYSKNTDQIKMLVFLDDKNKLKARAILWEKVYDEEGNVYKFMDRIYTTYDHQVNFFIKWAKENNYIIKHEQNSKSEYYFNINNEVCGKKMYVKLENFKLKYYPYLDTFKYFDDYDGCFYNYEKDYGLYKLTRTDGYVTDNEEYDEDEVGGEDIYYTDY